MAGRTTEDGDAFGGIDGETNVVYSTAEERAESTDLSVAVIETLAEAREESPVEMEQPLYDVVDPDALDRLFTADDADAVGRVVFELGAHEITVHSDGDILVRQIDAV